ncbi:hypothetical protein GDO78_017182 [Eleutherodactylus coqui]|uniref:Uncharacterized protein n=1 Tax=Eleutherodactylus coqui TaxID=57060 RepID=A0A8J6BAL2_ELECQ|nr:hypothetical protein GDO78_017182 [Eleutherodactylus coqui]
MSDLAIKALLPKHLSKHNAFSKVAYLTDTNSPSISSFRDLPSGYERWWITLKELGSFLGTSPNGDMRKFLNGGTQKGPATRPSWTSFIIFSRTMSG